MPNVNKDIVRYLRESVGIRGIGRLAGIAVSTVIKRIKSIAARIKEPPLAKGKTYEVDEMRTYVRHKDRLVWVVCALERKTKRIVRFSVGNRTNKTLKLVLDSLLLSEAKAIYTDGLELPLPDRKKDTQGKPVRHQPRGALGWEDRPVQAYQGLST